MSLSDGASTVSKESYKDLSLKRSSIKGRLTKFKNYLDKASTLDTFSSIQLNELTIKISRLEALSNEFDALQSQIEVLNPSSLVNEINERDNIEQDFVLYLATAQSVLDRHNKKDDNVCCSSNNSSHGHDNHNHSPGLKLPQIQISRFDGSYFRWLEFHDTFSTLIHQNNSIKTIHKFHYLLSYLQGEAARVISNIEVSEANYSDAWQLLCERYNNKRQLINFHLTALFNIKPVTRESETSLRYLVDHVTKNLRALASLGQPTNHWDTLIVFMVASKLDSNTMMKWEELRNTLDDSPTLSQFHKFLTDRANVLESLNKSTRSMQSKSNSQHSSHKPIISSILSNPATTMHNTASDSGCYICKKTTHRIYDCPIFQAKSVSERIAEASSLRLCLNCLRPGHSRRACRMGPCRECKRRHNTLLHIPNSSQTNPEPEVTDQNSIVAFSNQLSSEVLLCTALVKVINPVTNKHDTARALLDCGSQSSFISESLKQKLSLPCNATHISVLGIGNQCNNHVTENCTVKVQATTNSFHVTFTCLVLKQLTGLLPKNHINLQDLRLPDNIELADKKWNESAPVDMILGADVFWEILGSNIIKLGRHLPQLRSSQLGWLIAGNITPTHASVFAHTASSHTQCNHSTRTITTTQNNLSDIHDQMCRFWELEELPQNIILSSNDKLCEQHFIKNTTRSESGRFCVKLPLVDSPNCLGNSYYAARKRFLNLEKRFRRHPELKSQYVDFIREYASLGHLSECSLPVPEPNYYLSHHAVFKDSSESTKVRVVFDGSARTSSGFSINDLQLVGPTLQDSLFSIIIRARQHKYLLSGDIEKMYRNIEIHEDHRNFQLILWREDESQPLQTLRLNTVTYGFSSASFLSTRCLWQLGEECSDEQIKTIIQHDFYVDDLLVGADTEQEILHIQQSVSRMLSLGRFPLRKFRSNAEIIQQLPNASTADKLYLSQSTNVLGLGWNPTEDIFYFPTRLDTNENTILTKRSILSTLFKIFDPIGLLSPCVIKPKMLLQQLWLKGNNWDDPAPLEIISQWNMFQSHIGSLFELKIPRQVICCSPIFLELHTFSDASQVAYGACAYLLSKDVSGDVTVRLLCSKSKVAPLRLVTIPRLELCAALLAARLCKSVLDSLRHPVHSRVHWCDSNVVLGWLRNDPRTLKTFVANRCSEIGDVTDTSCWRYVPTSQNPADLISRGVDPQHIHESGLWWHGPSFLKKPESDWPKSCNQSYLDLPEIKQKTTNLHSFTNQLCVITFERYSHFTHLKRTFALVKRYIHNCKDPKNKETGFLSTRELNESFINLCKLAQQQSFPDECRALYHNKALHSKSKILSLCPFLDTDDVIRVGGRLDSSSYNYDKKHPILLHSSHHFTKLIFAYEHVRHLHAGPQLLLASLRDYVWPINGRQGARRAVRLCVTCRRLRPLPLYPQMGNLPVQRVTPDFPFLSVALDMAGPFAVLNRKGRGAATSKYYLAIFVCMRYKCLHLEAVSELSKDSFLLSLRRFMSRRGKPAEIFCDNGRNFVAAAKELGSFIKTNNASISGSAAQDGINFVFSPPYSPHFNGLAEAGVKSSKHHIKRVIGNTHLTQEEFSTLLAQVEAILNSRPLHPLSSSPDDLSFLSPGHFLIGRPLTSLPATVPDQNDNPGPLQRYARLEQIRRHFWLRWQKEYVSEMQSRTKWRQNYATLNVGDLVVIQEDNTPPLSWRLGRVARLFPGPDGVSRVADVNTVRGCVRRAFTRLCPLPKPDEAT